MSGWRSVSGLGIRFQQEPITKAITYFQKGMCPVTFSNSKTNLQTGSYLQLPLLAGFFPPPFFFFCGEKKKVLEAQSCLILCDCMDWSPPGPFIHGIFQATILEWVAIPFFRGSSPPMHWTQVSCFAGKFFTVWSTREAWDKMGSGTKWQKLFLSRQTSEIRGLCVKS